MLWSPERLNEVYLQMQSLATTDTKFRAELLVNANAAIEKHIGESLPEDYKVKAIEQDANYAITLVLPPMANELNEDDLEDVAGGGNYASPSIADVGEGERVIPVAAKLLGYGVGLAVGRAVANRVMS